MRVAIPVSSDGRVERVFDCATSLVVLDLRDRDRGKYFETAIRSRSMRERAREFAAMGINVVLCNEISQSFESLIRNGGIEVRTHHSGTVDEVMEAFVIGYLTRDRGSNDRPPAQVSIS